MMLSEAAVKGLLRQKAAAHGARLWVNNVGACITDSGRMVRYGLVNDSKKVNDYIKSSDLIGITPVLITEKHLGSIIGQFTAIECKREGWRFTDTKHERAQERFLELVNRLGGIASFASSVDDVSFMR